MPTRKKRPPRYPTWGDAVLSILRERGAPVTLRDLYSMVRSAAPHLVAGNPNHANDKIRQVVQRLGRKGLVDHVGKGVWAARS